MDFVDQFFQDYPNTLVEWQKSSLVHPYTCPNRGDNHTHNGRDLGVLSVTKDNTLVCDDCGYTQNTPEKFK